MRPDPPPAPAVSPRLRAFFAGVAVALLLAATALAFLAYQHPSLLLQALNLRYCG